MLANIKRIVGIRIFSEHYKALSCFSIALTSFVAPLHEHLSKCSKNSIKINGICKIKCYGLFLISLIALNVNYNTNCNANLKSFHCSYLLRQHKT